MHHRLMMGQAARRGRVLYVQESALRYSGATIARAATCTAEVQVRAPRASAVTPTVTSTDVDSESAAPARSTTRVDREVEVRRAAGEGRALEIVDHT